MVIDCDDHHIDHHTDHHIDHCSDYHVHLLEIDNHGRRSNYHHGGEMMVVLEEWGDGSRTTVVVAVVVVGMSCFFERMIDCKVFGWLRWTVPSGNPKLVLAFYSLKDFVGTEKHCRPSSVVLRSLIFHLDVPWRQTNKVLRGSCLRHHKLNRL
jgi:hypothetical protein